MAAAVTQATTDFTQLATDVASIGGLMLGAVVAGVAFKWLIAYFI